MDTWAPATASRRVSNSSSDSHGFGDWLVRSAGNLVVPLDLVLHISFSFQPKPRPCSWESLALFSRYRPYVSAVLETDRAKQFCGLRYFGSPE